jgi:ribosomal protein S17
VPNVLVKHGKGEWKPSNSRPNLTMRDLLEIGYVVRLKANLFNFEYRNEQGKVTVTETDTEVYDWKTGDFVRRTYTQPLSHFNDYDVVKLAECGWKVRAQHTRIETLVFKWKLAKA